MKHTQKKKKKKKEADSNLIQASFHLGCKEITWGPSTPNPAHRRDKFS